MLGLPLNIKVTYNITTINADDNPKQIKMA